MPARNVPDLSSNTSEDSEAEDGVLQLPTTGDVLHVVKEGGESVTFLHVALDIVTRLEEEPALKQKLDELRYLRCCLNAGHAKTQVPCKLFSKEVDAEEALTRKQLRRTYTRASAEITFPVLKGEPKSPAKSPQVTTPRETSKSTLKPKAQRPGQKWRGSQAAAADGQANGESADGHPRSPSKGAVPWMGPAVPQFPGTVPGDGLRSIQALFSSSFGSWDFDVFQLCKLSNGRPLQFVGWEAFRLSNCFGEFAVQPERTKEFLRVVESRYATSTQVPYHSNMHAADVTQTVIAFLKDIGCGIYFDPMDTLAMVFSAIIHDMGHDGKNNAFHVNVQDHLGLTYNDQSVLEQFHVAEAFKLMVHESDADLFKDLQQEQRKMLRREVIDLVLGTDMAHHFGKVGDFGKLVSEHGKDPEAWQSTEGAMDVLRSMVLHSADISNPVKKFEIARKWTYRLLQEFFNQGEAEEALGLPVSPLCCRKTTNVASSQVGFICFIIQPTYQALAGLLPRVGQICIQELEINKLAWEERKAYVDGFGLEDLISGDDGNDWIKSNGIKWQQSAYNGSPACYVAAEKPAMDNPAQAMTAVNGSNALATAVAVAAAQVFNVQVQRRAAQEPSGGAVGAAGAAGKLVEPRLGTKLPRCMQNRQPSPSPPPLAPPSPPGSPRGCRCDSSGCLNPPLGFQTTPAYKSNLLQAQQFQHLTAQAKARAARKKVQENGQICSGCRSVQSDDDNAQLQKL